MFDVPKGPLLVFSGGHYSRGDPSRFVDTLMFCDASHHAPTVTIHEIIDLRCTMFTDQWESWFCHVNNRTILYPECEFDRTSAPCPMAKYSVNMCPGSCNNHVHSLRPGLPCNGFLSQVYPELRAVLLACRCLRTQTQPDRRSDMSWHGENTCSV